MRAFNLDEEPDAAPRRLRPDPLRPGLPAGPPAGRGRRHVRRGPLATAGTPTSRTTRESASSPLRSIPAFATLITDLKQRGMLDSTLVVWMGEFGRTPKINPNAGRDHFPKVFNVALAGGGVKGGQVIGASTADGDRGQGPPRRRPRPAGLALPHA